MKVKVPSGTVDLTPEGRAPVALRFQSEAGWALFHYQRYGWFCRTCYKTSKDAYLGEAEVTSWPLSLVAMHSLLEAANEAQTKALMHGVSDPEASVRFTEFIAAVAVITKTWPLAKEDEAGDYVDEYYEPVIIDL